MLFATSNLLRQSVSPDAVPWDYQPQTPVPERVRSNKAERQSWYSAPATQHQFYSGVEGANPNVRIGSDNPPHRLHAICADFDLPLPKETVLGVIAAWKVKPSYLEKTLGGNWRPVWLLQKPLPVGSLEFYGFLMDKAKQWLKLDALPGLDTPAFRNPTRLYCNGCEWTSLGHPPIPENEAQTFLVDCVREYTFKGCGDEVDIPLDLIETALRKKYPHLDWPTEFVVDSAGPSFFVEGSQSPRSAFVKKGGIFTFSGHAFKSFYSWADLLGADFVRDFRTNSIAEATKDTWFDGKTYWRKDPLRGLYLSDTKDTLTLAMRIQSRLSMKADKTGISPVDSALHHINTAGRIDGAAPLVFRESGVVECAGRRILNIASGKVMKPAPEPQTWGAAGNFPVLSNWLDNFFDPAKQLEHFLAWWKHFYEGGLELKPRQGQTVYLMGPTGIGKTAINRGGVGASVGGFVDASEHLVGGGSGFNSQMFFVPLWCVDDESVSAGDERRKGQFHAAVKKLTANPTHLFHAKFQIPVTTEWMGRAFVTLNPDYTSTRILHCSDDNSGDKVNLYRCVSERKVVLPPKHAFEPVLQGELPFFLRWLLDWSPPEWIERDSRYGFTFYHEPLMLERASQTSKASPLAEVLQAYLDFFFSTSPQKAAWTGTATQLFGAIHLDPTYEPIVRRYTLEQFTRSLEAVVQQRLLKGSSATDPETKSRIWTFDRR